MQKRCMLRTANKVGIPTEQEFSYCERNFIATAACPRLQLLPYILVGTFRTPVVIVRAIISRH